MIRTKSKTKALDLEPLLTLNRSLPDYYTKEIVYQKEKAPSFHLHSEILHNSESRKGNG